MPGETVTVNVRLGENTSGLIAMDLLISYSQTHLTMVSAQYYAGSPIAFGNVAPNINQRPMHLGFSQPPAFPIVTANATGTGTLAVLEFEIADGAPMNSTHAISVAVTNADGGDAGVMMPVSRLANTGTSNGRITVGEASDYDVYVYTTSVSGTPGETVTVNVRLGENTSGLIAMDLLISYTQTHLTMVSAQYYAGSPIAFGNVAPNINQRPMHLGFSQPPAFPIVNANANGTGTLAVLEFEICEDAPLGSTHPISVQVTNADGGDAGVMMPVSRLANTGTSNGVITVAGDPDPTFLVTVVDSHATVTGEGDYEAGETVTIDAGTRGGYNFSGWETTSAGVTFANAANATTTFVMPANPVTVTATWTAVGTPPPPGNRIAVSNQPIITPGPDANPCSYGSDLVEGTRVTFEIMVRVPSVAKSNAYLFMCLPGNLLVNPTIISAECMIDGVLSLTAAVHPDVNEVFIPLGDLQPNTYLLLSLRMDITDDIENGQYNLIRFFSVIYD